MGKTKKLQQEQHDIMEARDFQTGKEPKKLNMLTSKDLVKMTDNFSKKNFIGKFQFGKLYRGFLDQQHLTIKIWDFTYHRNLQNHELRLMDELILLRHQRLVHPCIVSLYGYCRDKEHVAVVYNLKSMDSLHNLVQKEDFTWIQRIKVAFAFACLLKFFQDRLGDLDPFVIRNLSAEHVILDEEYNPKLVDFSMITGGIFPNKRVYFTQPAYGSFGYWDPDLIRDSKGLAHWTKESDVFAFGVALISLLSKRLLTMSKEWNQVVYNFVEDWALEEFEKGESLVHESLQSDPTFFDVDGHKLSSLCINCTSRFSKDRPNIVDVIRSISNLSVSMDHKEFLGFDKMFYVNKKLHPSVSKPLNDIIEARDTRIDHLSCDGTMDIVEFDILRMKFLTNNFSQENYIGSFQFGKLFRGLSRYFIGDVARHVIVKIWDKKNSLDDNLLRLGDEMLLLHHEKYTCHPGMARMFGYWVEDDNVGIVLFCKAIDSLHNLLPRDDFEWLHRIKAVCGVASLLKFLHAASHRMDPFVVGNLDSTHILLDEKYNPKLVDFGLISGGVFPNRSVDEIISGNLTTEGDVFSFGRILIDLISKRSIDVPIRACNDELLIYEATLEKCLVHQSLQDAIMYYPEDGMEITRLAVQCVQTNPACRPTMSQVVEAFHKLKVVECDPDVMSVEKVFRDKCSIKLNNPMENMPPKGHHMLRAYF